MAAAKNLYLCYDLDRHRAVARTFLEELKANRPDARIVAASRREEIAATQRPAVMAERMRGVDIAIVLIGPQTALSRNVSEEVLLALKAKARLVGVLVDGATPKTNIPAGMARDQIHGWDWGALGRALR